MDLDLAKVNNDLRHERPERIIEWAVSISKRPILTTNFGPYEAALLHECVKCKPDITVIWCDSGYNTAETYRHAEELIARLKLNITVYLPTKSTAHRNAVMGSIPGIDDPRHTKFTEDVKLEPFRRAMAEHDTDLWFTNVRKGQTEFRDSLDIATESSQGILKVSPFFYWADDELIQYLDNNNLPNETNYFDPTKVLQHRECGLHTD